MYSKGFTFYLQGHARRILTRVKPTANSGTLPLICESITSVSVGCICARSKLQKGLDSYQEEDLNLLRERWSEALSRRHEYLDSHIHKLINKQGGCTVLDITPISTILREPTKFDNKIQMLIPKINLNGILQK